MVFKQSEPSVWAQQRFGQAAPELTVAVSAAVQYAHERALAAHVASGLTSNDAYGATMMVQLHLALAAFTEDILGVVARKPSGVRSRFPYVVVEDTSVALMPWRFATDASVSRTDAKLPGPVSDLRRTLLGLSARAPYNQPSLEDAFLETFDVDEALAEESEMLRELERMGTVVTLALASNPANGIVSLGWGDAELTNPETGEVRWHAWEDIPLGLELPLESRPVVLRPAPDSVAIRFDDAPEDEILLSPQPPLTVSPTGEGEDLTQGDGNSAGISS